jgi:hypothetical protein
MVLRPLAAFTHASTDLATPPLPHLLRQVRETSRTSLFRPSTLLPAAKKSIDAVRRDFKDIILPGGLHDRVRSLAAAAANTKLHGAPYRHMLFYGELMRVLCWAMDDVDALCCLSGS